MGLRELWAVLGRLPRWGTSGFADALARQVDASPHCPVLRYLLGCQLLDAGRPATAVQHFMVAYHREPQLESASLLVFAGLNWTCARERPLLAVLLDTCREVRHPAFDRTRLERALLDRFAEPPPDPSSSAARLHRLPVRSVRAQLREPRLLPRSDESQGLLATR